MVRHVVMVSLTGLLLAIGLPGPGAQAQVVVQPGAPGMAGTHLDPGDLQVPERPKHTEADVRFMQNMMHHHQQAVAMARMAFDRTERPQILLLAERIERTQADEIAYMTRWLELRGEEVPELDNDPEAHPHHDHEPHRHRHHHEEEDRMMAGMLTPEQLEELAAARDEAFDRLLLAYMIYHHEGALQMVSELFASPGAAQDSEIFQFASHVEADQAAEILRMERFLWLWSTDTRRNQ